MFKNEAINVFKNYYKEEKQITTHIEDIRSFYDMYKQGEYDLDDQTWDDLDLDRLFYKIDRSNSSLGQSVLYGMLRSPIFSKDELKKRDGNLKELQKNKNLRAELQYVFFKLGYDKKNRLMEMLHGDLVGNKFRAISYKILKWIPILLILLTAILGNYKFLIAAGVVFLLNLLICEYERKNVTSNGLVYLNEIFMATKKILELGKGESINTEKIRAIYDELQDVRSNIRMVNIVTFAGGFLEPILNPFLIMESSYYSAIDGIKNKKDSILDLYYELGKIESYISMSIYKEIKGDKCCNPQFIDDVKLEVKNGIHPLLKNPVSNSIVLDKKGIVLTGTNMSGKSTFLRMLGINILFAQTFNFALAKEYKGSFFNIVTSISPSDDVNEGKSYYMAEAEAILRIIKELDREMPVLCIIDEIFRGTNPVERIAASAAILTYINKAKAITFVATHDRELTDMLKNTYDFYYFSEKVDEENGLSFDYKLKDGISKTRNAIKVLDYIGYPKEITNLARKYAEGSKK